MAHLYHVSCSNLRATYRAGSYLADSPAEAIDLARRAYANSPVGRELGDVGQFRFWIRKPASHLEED